MKVLLLGDFSGFHLNLATGLKHHNIDVTLASGGDGFKNYKYDVLFRTENRTKLQKKEDHRNFRQWLDEFDVIQLNNVAALDEYMTLYLYARANSKKAKVFCCTIGSDYVFWTEGRKILNIPLFDEVIKTDKSIIPVSWKQRLRFELVRRSIDGFLGPYEYHESYHIQNKRLSMVLHPINISNLIYRPLNLGLDQKIIIYHGVSKGREGFKGSLHILKAFEVARQKYAKHVQCLVTHSVPYQEYLDHINKAHVVFDQTNAHSYGMAALEGMGMGKIVATCSQNDFYWDRWIKEASIQEKPPLLPLTPDYRQILSQIEWLIENKAKLHHIAEQGRQYVEKYHDCNKVALSFLERWTDS